MFRDVNMYVEFIAKNKLTQAQFLLLYCLRFNETDAINNYKRAFPTDDGTMIGKPSIQDLMDRGFIVHIGDSNRISDYKITDKFNHAFIANHFMAGEELQRAYPGYVIINGANIPLTTMDSYQLANLYAERIKYSIEEHLQVIEDVKYGRDHNLISSKIENFVKGEIWLKIREIRRGNKQILRPDLTQSF